MPAIINEGQLKSMLESQFNILSSNTKGVYGGLLTTMYSAFERKHHAPMSTAKKMMLMQSYDTLRASASALGVTEQDITSAVSAITAGHTIPRPVQSGAGAQPVMSAAQDPANVANPVTFMLGMMSILVPNFAYTEAVGIQTLPSKTSSIYVPQISATENRNGYVPGQTLLGATNWAQTDNYTTNQVKVAGAASGPLGAAVGTITASLGTGIVPGSVVISATGACIGSATGLVTPLSFQDDGHGGFLADPYIAGAASVNYATGAVSIVVDPSIYNAATAAVSVTGFAVQDPDQVPGENTIGGPSTPPYGRQNPAQVTLEFESKPITAVPFRVRSTFSLDDYYAAQKVLAGYDINKVMEQSVAGLVNKEISGNVFNQLKSQADALYSWNSTPPSGVSWAIHRLSVLEMLIAAKNGIRQNIQRSGGNVIVVGTGLMNHIETLDKQLWQPVEYDSEPIGPYVAGTLNGIKVIKNQAAGWEDSGVMVYKSSDADASVIGGVYIPLYFTPPIALDTGKVVRGLGTQVGFKKIFENSIVELGITGDWQSR